MWPFKKFQAEPFDVSQQKENKVKIEGTSLKDILMDDHKSVLFGKMLESDKDASAIFLKLRKSEKSLAPDDFGKLVEYKKTFEQRFAEAEKVKGLLTEKRFVSLAKNSEGLAGSIEVLGAEASYRAIHSSLETLAIKGDANFLEIQNKLLELIDIEKNTKENNERITAWCQKYKIETGKIAEIFNNAKDDDKRDVMLNKVIEDSLGFWMGGATRWAPRLNVSADINAKQRLDDLRKGGNGDLFAKIKPDEIPKAQEGIATILNLTLSTNDEVLKAVTKNLRPEVKAGEEVVGDLSFSNLGNNLGDDKEVLGAWEQFKTRNPLAKGESINDEYRNDFEQSYTEKKIGKKSGFWSKIAQSFVRGMFGNLKAEFN